MFRVQAFTRRTIWCGMAMLCLLCFTSMAGAQAGGGQGGGGFTGGGGGFTGGGGGFTGGGGFAGGGGFTGGMSSRNQMPGAMRGFRPLVSTTGTGFRNQSQFGQVGGGGQFGQFGGGGQFGGVTGGGFGRGQQMGVFPTRISGAGLSESIKPAPPPFPEIQGRLEKLLRVSSGEFEGRKIVLDLEGAVLVIRGTVRNEYEKQLTESLARLEPGVRDVKNELTVASPSRTPETPSAPPPGPSPPANPGGGNRPP